MKSVHFLCSKLAITTLAGAALSLAALTPITAAPIAAGSCVATAMKYKVSTTSQSTGSTTKDYVDVIDTRIDFTQGGNSNSCVIVSFSAQADTGGAVMQVRALLDGSECLPTDNNFVGGTGAFGTFPSHAMNYVCENVAPGNHRVKMQFRTQGEVALWKRTIIVHFVK
jgi:hypothetical protein